MRISDWSSDVCSSDLIRFEVCDTGLGIDEHQLRAIFEPFEQVGDKRLRTSGTGLGLSISRQLIGLMNSRIEIESKPGEGSRFWFELDMPIADAAPLPGSPVASVTGYLGPRRSVLIVDDMTENRAVLSETLGEMGFITRQASHGLTARHDAEATRPDLILMDVRMPVMGRSEEHTSELQSLMRISYAVFCLKKK